MKKLLKIVSVILTAAVLASCSKVSGFGKDSVLSAFEKNGVREVTEEEFDKGPATDLTYYKYKVEDIEKVNYKLMNVDVVGGEFSDFYICTSQNGGVGIEIIYANYIQDTKAQADFDSAKSYVKSTILGTGKEDDGKDYAMAFVNANTGGQKDPEKEEGKYWYKAIYKDGTGILAVSVSIQNTTFDPDQIDKICKDIGVTSPTTLS